jgi:hypothetical protein
MAVTNLPIGVPSGASRYENTATNNTKSAVKASSGTLYAIVVDNTANAAISYVKLWDLGSGSVTVGTTAPDMIFKIPASGKKTIIFQDGLAFATALTEATVTAGGTAGVTSPSSNVILDIVYA